MREGEQGEHVYLIAEGSTEVTAAAAGGPVPLATLSAGDIFGEIALLSPSRLRTASVTATSESRLFRLGGAGFRRLIGETPGARAAFEAAARVMTITRFIELAASPFAKLDLDRARWLAERLQEVEVAAGDTIIRQGEEGDRCFLIRAGQVEVVAPTKGEDMKLLATLGPGSMFGEAALLTSAPRNSTVIATEACELLVLLRSDLLQVMSDDVELGGQLRELLQLRARPKRTTGIMVVPGTSRAGEDITILKDPARHAYYRLSPEGRFIWERLDGELTIKDLTLAYFKEFKAFAPQAIIGTIVALREAGFVQPLGLRPDVAGMTARSGGSRLLAVVLAVLEWNITLRRVDGVLAWLYRNGVCALFTRPAQFLLALTASAGVVLFFADAQQAARTIQEIGPWMLAWAVGMQGIVLVVHELGHAFATKAIGREVHGVGVGWYWFGPVAFVDTTDTWLATRRQRIAVSFAGPYINLLLGGALALAAHWQADPTNQAFLWQFAFVSLMAFVFNFNPLLEYDGYYILSDWLDRPNLRRQALGWLGNGLLPGLKRDRRALREHWFDILFGISSIIYVLCMGWISLVAYRLFFEGWLTNLIPGSLAAALAWLFVSLVVVASLTSVIRDMRSSRVAAAA